MDRTGRILVVDDEPLNRELLGAMVEILGHEMLEAANGAEALECIVPDIDLVLLDVMMPGIDGFQVLQRVKADPLVRHIPIVMISALHEMEMIAGCIERGADDYLPKPFNKVLLKARITSCLEKKWMRDREQEYLQQIQAEKRRSDELLHVILPHEIILELTTTDAVKPRRYENVAILFCDIVDFTPYCASRPPEEVIAWLQKLIEAYEELTLRYGMEKIKTTGDSFMAAASLLRSLDDPVQNCVRCGLEMIATARNLPIGWNVRVGIHVGPVVAGVVGHRQYLFDLWGDTVNTAARVESCGRNGAVNLSDTAWLQVAHRFQGQSLGFVPVKGKGEMEIFHIDGLDSAVLS